MLVRESCQHFCIYRSLLVCLRSMPSQLSLKSPVAAKKPSIFIPASCATGLSFWGRRSTTKWPILAIAQMLFLEAEDPTKDIYLYINSPGGAIYAGMGIFDTMEHVQPAVCTVCMGLAASMGAFLLGAGAPGKRMALPNARIMIHQPLGGAQGQATDVEIQAKETLFVKRQLNQIMAERTGQPLEKIEQDTDRDFFMSPAEAQTYGLIDTVIEKRLLLPSDKRPTAN